jgi:predicted metalloprotease with PDZ domain
MFSVGLFLDQQRKVKDVLWNGPAFKAWLAPSMELVAIDGHPYSTAVLRSEIAQAQKNRKALQITAKGDGVTEVYVLDYDDGLDCPHLVRVPRATDYLQQILAPKPLDNGS